MANTRAQRKVEEWIRKEWLPVRFRRPFHCKPQQIPLTSGGAFAFDAVSEDGKVVANVSTSTLKTASGNRGSGKINKVRSDIYFLLLAAGAEKKVMLLTERDMYEAWLEETDHGRVPDSVLIRCVDIPGPLREKLERARRNAIDEMG